MITGSLFYNNISDKIALSGSRVAPENLVEGQIDPLVNIPLPYLQGS